MAADAMVDPSALARLNRGAVGPAPTPSGRCSQRGHGQDPQQGLSSAGPASLSRRPPTPAKRLAEPRPDPSRSSVA
jgi:hypothetical protein